jgi:ABC-type multidrug transport system fused ATPase/permease subunit
MIYVMNKGHFVEVGTHDNLMKNTQGIYYDMFTKHLIKE